MKLHDLRPDPGAHKQKKRVGRGISAGQGKTAGRGTKGQNARPGGSKAPYFEGGQLPLVRRLPFKRGFTNLFRIEYQEVNVGDLTDVFAKGAQVNPETLVKAGLIKDVEKPVAILGDGELGVALNITAHRFTTGAKTKIEAAGGSINKLELLQRGARATIKLLPKSQRPGAKEK